MIAVTENRAIFEDIGVISPQVKASKHVEVLTDIYREDTNIAVWQRDITTELTLAVDEFLHTNQTKTTTFMATPENTYDLLCEKFGDSTAVKTLSKDVAVLVDMFCCLFELKEAGLRLTILEHAMCPRFHFDRIPCRLITTYRGVGTQWLPHDVVDRSKLGAGNQGKSDEESGLFNNLDDIKQLSQGDVALLKGEGWNEHEGAGLVHRSPAIAAGERRLIVTLDFVGD
ncbi:DUF1826 domain-containing protein [Colwellia echini]|uniref:DUF1826 domain-containing protein n=1 Tax=Colwellia echini TaxID=1982103 RepID=A0ABY3MX34_9GAMM|nr:DUF1826 domain-containing protein [Colwellia echini]TYK65751.1 DUF1826 domain-containing protein [Colwellia echini]